MSDSPRKSQDVEAYGVEKVQSPLTKIITTGENREFIHIGETRLLRHELMEAVGAHFSNQLHEVPQRKFANSSVLGLCAFSLSTFVLALVNLQAKGVDKPNIVCALAWFYGGMVQIMVGMWEIVHQNTFACTTFTSYGAFFLSFAALNTPAFGIQAAYGDDIPMLMNAVGFYVLGWFIFSFLITIVTIRSSWPLFILFITITMSFLMNVVGYFGELEVCFKVSGGFSIATAACGWYMALEGLSSKETCYFKLNPFLMPGAQHVPQHN